MVYSEISLKHFVLDLLHQSPARRINKFTCEVIGDVFNILIDFGILPKWIDDALKGLRQIDPH